MEADGDTGLSLDKAVKEGMKEYSYRIINEQFPSSIDGLKAIHRRILWALRDIHDHGVPSTTAIGNIKVYHDHGDSAIYDTIIRLAQHWQVKPNLTEVVDGSYGSYTSPKAAAARYTRIGLSNFTKDVFFNGIDLNALIMTQGMDLQLVEPKYFVPAVPLALIMRSMTVGFGYNSKTIARNFSDICDITTEFCKHVSKKQPMHLFDITKYSEKLLPDFAIKNYIVNHEELLEQYKQGNFNHPVQLEGTSELSKYEIRIFTLPVEKGFEIQSVIRDAIDKGKKSDNENLRWIENNIIDAIADPHHITIQLKKNNSTVFEAMERIKSLITYTDTYHSFPNFINSEGFMVNLTPLDILSVWYQKRHELLLSSKRRQLRRLYEHLRILEALLIICDHTDKVISIIRNNDKNEAVKQLMDNFKLTMFQCDHLIKAPLSSLSKTSKEELNERYNSQKNRIEEVQSSFNKIPEEISDHVLYLKKKYGKDRTSVLSDFKGYIHIQDGYVQFESPDEIHKLYEAFPNVPFYVHTYTEERRVVHKNRKIIEPKNKYSHHEILDVGFTGNDGFTSVIKDGYGYYIKGIYPGSKRDGFSYTNNDVMTMFRSGIIKPNKLDKILPLRKSVGKGVKTNIVYLFPYKDDPVYVIAACSDDKNILHLQKIYNNGGKILLPPIGDIFVGHSYTGIDWFFSLTNKYLSRLSNSSFCIKDAEELLEGKNKIRLELASSKLRQNIFLQYI